MSESHSITRKSSVDANDVEVATLGEFLGALFPGFKEWSARPENEARHKAYEEKHAPHVYAIRNMANGQLKLGFSTQPFRRLRALQTLTSDVLTLFALWRVPSQKIEGKLHRQFKAWRMEGEWFQLGTMEERQLFQSMQEYAQVSVENPSTSQP